MPDDAKTMPRASRRGLMQASGLSALGVALGGAGAPGYPAPSRMDTGGVEGGRVTFPNWRGQAEPEPPPPPAPLPPGERVGYAIVGLGRLSLEEILPAFGACRQSRPVALVSGSPEKAAVVARQYGIPDSSVLGYDNFEDLRQLREVRAVYIVLPNGMHREYTERAAAIGKHVLCEKPMANTPEEAQAMVEACARAGVKLMVAYRCQYEPHSRAAIRLVRFGELGKLRFIHATNVQSNGPGPQWRYAKALAGGGALPDIGLYCLNATRYLTGEEPVEVSAQMQSPAGDPRFAEVEESMDFRLRFPSGIVAQCVTSYGAFQDKTLRLLFENGLAEIPDAFAYRGQRLFVSRKAGEIIERQERVIARKNQFATEIDHFSERLRAGEAPHTPGEEGLQDQRLMAALYRAATEGRPVEVPSPERRTRGPEPAEG
ncbi:Gfo/Idh/MocA family oxidoreductase [Roseomonas sp. OT10]|uniref:Gfo/Idh/MocA family protein n=1 Tax=Roseomonas cutis TaxID=2897332 RepID=UPI001E512977|nr:Gfo/Idh/MocA family oxidoreductase [Roseomonas sp. OT10]UFN47937.1 Gfo/Idh/MocA family oxidoreductase [Roseomonas sp. OT10]